MLLTILNTAKSIAANKTVQQVLKFIASSTILYMGNKLSLKPNKVDKYDMKNLVYQHNMNYDDKLNPKLMEESFSLYRILEFIKKYNEENNISMTENDLINFANKLIKSIDSKRDPEELIKYCNKPIVKLYDDESKKTSSLIDTLQLNSGLPLMPKILTMDTDEGQFIANNKNRYLENRMNVKDNDIDKIREIIKNYHRDNQTKKVIDYFNANI